MAEDEQDTGGPDGYMEIGGADQRRNIVGIVSYVLVFGALCGLLVLLFVRFTGSLRLALGVVVFMVVYMGLMGWWASKRDDRSS